MDTFTEQFAEFAAALTQAEDFDDTVEQLVSYAVKAVGAACGGITLIRAGGRFETVGATDPKVVQADMAQYALREGPCVQAATEERSILSGSLGTDARWPRWGPIMQGLGYNSALSAAIHGRGARIGALNLFGLGEDSFSVEDVELARVLALQSAAVMASRSNEEGLREALETRSVIGQAQGMLMERFGIDPGQAFSVLRRFSQDSNIRLRDVAAELVESRRTPN